MPDESEAKFKVRNLAAARKALKAAGAEHLETVLHTDSYFDTPDSIFCDHDWALRIRQVRPLRGKGKKSKPRALLTFKGPTKPDPKIKIRPEVQRPVDNPDAFAATLCATGLVIKMKIQKRRTSYRLGDCRVELDELPLIGCFVEIEGPDKKAILAAGRRLSLKGEPITQPYTRLLLEHCSEHGIPHEEVLFEK
jgi:adenylate cyclase class 2